MDQFIVSFNGNDYIATYNSQTGYYEVEIEAPETGGIYTAEYTVTNVFGQTLEDSQDIQVFAKEQPKLSMNKVFLWIFDYYTFKLKDIVEISDYELNIDEETNANSFINILKKTSAKARDIVAVKKNNKVVYWGIIDNIENEDGKQLYKYTLKYITNLFNQNVVLSQNVDGELQEGYYCIKSALNVNEVFDVEAGSIISGANIRLWNRNNTYAQIWKITKNPDGTYLIVCVKSNMALEVAGAVYQDGTNVQQWEINGNDAQKWIIENVEGNYYNIKTVVDNLYVTVNGTEATDGTNIKIATYRNEVNRQRFIFEKVNELEMKLDGIEDFIATTINENFINSKDRFVNKNYLELIVKTHTPKQTSVTNVENGIYNLHTWMTNCTQNYNVVYDFNIVGGKLVITIDLKDYQKELIDVQAQPISNYSEVFETNIVSKVIVLTSTNTYTLYLLNDRTTTTDGTNPNRAAGRVETVYTENYDDAPQRALDVIKANTYNHNITFNYLDRFIKIGTPIAIKTKESLIYDTYISSIKITPKNFIEYICGNIRIGLIEKLNQERNK